MSGTQLKVWIIVAVASVIVPSIMAIGGVIAVYKRYYDSNIITKEHIDSESNDKRCMLKCMNFYMLLVQIVQKLKFTIQLLLQIKG